MCQTSDEFLIRFIKASNYNVKNSFQLIKDYYRAKLELPDEFICKPASSYEDIFCRMDLGFLLPQEDALGRTLVLLRFGNLDPGLDDWNRCIQSVILVFEWLSLKPNIQDKGICVILDCTNLSYRIMKWATPHKLKTIVKILQECIPVRIEVIHVANAPYVFNLFYAALKPFLKDRFHEKFKWHKHPFTNLLNDICIESLPKWLGGTLNIDTIKYWYKELFKYEDILKEDFSMGYLKHKFYGNNS